MSLIEGVAVGVWRLSGLRQDRSAGFGADNNGRAAAVSRQAPDAKRCHAANTIRFRSFALLSVVAF